MKLLKDLKFQVALVGLIAAIVHFFVPDIDEKSLIEVITVLVSVILGGHSIADYAKTR
jgi:hypothetical protein